MALPNPQASNLFQPSLHALDGRKIQLRSPWRRYFAKTIDHVIVALLSIPYFTIALVGVALVFDQAHLSESQYLFLFLLIFTVSIISYDSVLLATWGTTPGKRLFGLTVRTHQKQKLEWSQSFSRSVWVNGLLAICGLVPLLPLAFMVYQKQRLCRTGFTSWDAPDETLVYRV